ncbi:MAG: choice-of-anchor D domain-containing protein [Bacteroidota bacterium]|nr:choice-of-anchor D domain-containing protein [Bacteroidota bacterium]
MNAQDIRTSMTVFDNLGHSRILTVGINASATDSIDLALGEFPLAPPVPGTFDARLIDTDIRTPSLLGNGVYVDLRAIGGTPPIVQTFEIAVRRAPGAMATYLTWALPLADGIIAAQFSSYPDPSIVSADMAVQSQVLLPFGTNRYLVRITYAGPLLQRWTLTTQIEPPGKGNIIRSPNLANYAPGTVVRVTALNLPPPDTCYEFSHWTGDASGTNPVIFITMDGDKTVTAHYVQRKFPVTVSTLDTFFVQTTPSPPQKLFIMNSGLACYGWTATATEPWIHLSKSAGIGDDSLIVSLVTSAIPCPGTHIGTIRIHSTASIPETIETPVIVNVGRTDVTASVIGAPVLLSCETVAQDLIVVTLANQSPAPVTFADPPPVLRGFNLKNSSLFPLTIPALDSVNLYYEFRPLSSQRGIISEHVILTATTCGRQVMYKLTGTRIAPTVISDLNELRFGTVYSCVSAPLPLRSLTIENLHTTSAQLRYTIPTGFVLRSAPPLIGAGGQVVVSVEPTREGPDSISGTLVIEADFGVCRERLSIGLSGRRQTASFTAEALATPGVLPPQVFDTTCVGEYSEPKKIRIRNTGTADLTFTLTTAPPFELSAFSDVFTLSPGSEKDVSILFHPVTAGHATGMLTIRTDLCNLERNTMLEGSTFSQQVLEASLTPLEITLADCEEEGRLMISVRNPGTQPAVFPDLPLLPEGFFWDPSLTLPIVIPPDGSSSFQTYITFHPPSGGRGTFGGSVVWFGSPCGTSVYFTLTGSRILPKVSVSPVAVDFGVMTMCRENGVGTSKTMSVANQSALPILLTASAPASRYRLEIDHAEFPTQGVIVPAYATQEFSITALPGGGGPFTDSLVLLIFAGTNGSCMERKTVPLSGERHLADFAVRQNPGEPGFMNVCIGSQAISSYIIENLGDTRITIISDGLVPESGFSLLTTPFRTIVPPHGTATIPVRFRPIIQGIHRTSLRIWSDICPDTVVLDLEGSGITPVFEIARIEPAAPVTILSCERTISRQFRATVRNLGTDPVVIVDASFPPTGFVYDPPGQFPFTLAPSASRDIVLRFTATEAGEYGGEVHVTSGPCPMTASFPVHVSLLHSSYTLEPREASFGTITFCPDGTVREADRERMLQEINLQNNGAVPLTVHFSVKPSSSPIQVLTPTVTPVTLNPGSRQNFSIALSDDLDPSLRSISAALEITILRPDSACPPETITVPITSRFERVSFAFLDDSVSATVSCAAEPVKLHAVIVNTGNAAVTVDLTIEGSTSFRIADSLAEVHLAPNQRLTIPVIYTPEETQTDSAVLRARDRDCGWESSVRLHVFEEKTEIRLSCGTKTGMQQSFETLPGTILEVPLFLSRDVRCGVNELTFSVDVLFDVFQLAPVGLRTVGCEGWIERPEPDRARITLTSPSFRSGLVATVLMEVLVGKEKLSEYSIGSPVFKPGIGVLATDLNCTATVHVRPYFGVSSWADLGITRLFPPRPNPLTVQNGTLATISFELARDGFAELTLYDRLGNRVAVIVSESLEKGLHTIEYHAAALPSGVYLIVLSAGGEVATEKLIVAR